MDFIFMLTRDDRTVPDALDVVKEAIAAGLQQAVLRGFDPMLNEGHPLFDICAIQHVVCHLLSHARQPGRFPASLYSAHLRRRHRAWLRGRARARTTALAV